VPEDLSPSRFKLEPLVDGFIIHNITGIRTQIVRRLDDQGYDIRRRMVFALFYLAYN
jgi:mannosidase alpha-like ER degradation enhancer 1